MGETRDNKISNSILRKIVQGESKKFTRKDLSILTGLSQTHIFSKKAGFPGNDNEQGLLDKKMVGLLYLCTGADLKHFQLNKKLEDELLKDIDPSELGQYFTSKFAKKISKYHSSKKDKSVKVINLPLDTDTDNYAESYTKKILKYYINAKQSIQVVETLFKGNNKNPVNNLKGYRLAHRKIFKAIQDKLKALKNENSHLSRKERSKLFRYKRVLCLSPSESIHSKKSTEDQIKALYIESSPEVLYHMKKCLRDYPEFCEFYVSPFTRFRHQCLIDNDILLTEDYIKNLDSIVPDEIFIDNLKSSNQKELKKMKRIFDKQFLKKDMIPIDNSILKPKILEDLKQEINERIKGQRMLFKIFLNQLFEPYIGAKRMLNKEDQLMVKRARKSLFDKLDDLDTILLNQNKNLTEKFYLLYSANNKNK